MDNRHALPSFVGVSQPVSRMNLPISSVQFGKRLRKNYGDIHGLAMNMRRFGMLSPVLITPTRDLVDGERRLLAARLLGWHRVPVLMVDTADPIGLWQHLKSATNFWTREELAERVDPRFTVEDWIHIETVDPAVDS